MGQFEKDDITQRFWDAETEIKEEESIIGKWKNGSDQGPLKDYAHYIIDSRKYPSDLEASVWNSIKPRSRNMLHFSQRLAIAASIALLIAIGGILVSKFNNNTQGIYELAESNNYASECNFVFYVAGPGHPSLARGISSNCIEILNETRGIVNTGTGYSEGIIEVSIKSSCNQLFAICEGMLYFGQNGNVQMIDIYNDCAPKLMIDCQIKPLCDIEKLQPEKVKSIALTINPVNCDIKKGDEYIVVEM